VKVLDFGIAKAEEGARPRPSAARFKGKYGYMSPEQCKGKPNRIAAADIFALGICLYELTTAAGARSRATTTSRR